VRNRAIYDAKTLNPRSFFIAESCDLDFESHESAVFCICEKFRVRVRVRVRVIGAAS
jgi:hypothetical protein